MSDDMVIVANAATCLLCGDSIYSGFRHDYATCSCGSCSVDGGCDYFKMSYKDREQVEINHILASEDFLSILIKEIDSSMKSGRNARGIAYAALRAIRDSNANFKIDSQGTIKWICNK